MKPVRTERLILRNWEERDRDLFFRINSNDRVMAFFPFRRDRAAADAMLDRLRREIAADGYGFAAVELAATGACAGFAGLARADYLEPALPAGAVENGWRLAPEFWGRGYATEAARAWLAFGFEALGLPEIISFAVWNNHRSTAVMERIGMSRDAAGDFDHPKVPDTHPELRRHVLYRLRREDWPGRDKAAG
jgi:RimJ/RimL family protein N-acetyltransferase